MNIVQPVRDLSQLESMKKVLKSTNIRDYAMFVVGINIGLRISDLLSLRWQDVADGRGRPFNCVTIREIKTGKERTFKLNKNAQKALVELVEANGYTPEGFLFRSRKGQNRPISRVQAWEILNHAARTIGIREKIGSHSLRKTFGYFAFKQGASLTLLMKVFGHSSEAITARYIGITQDDINQVYVNLNI
jgi:integrase